MEFIGMICACQALGEEIEEQIKKENVVCVECEAGFITLARNIIKNTDINKNGKKD